MKYSYAYFLSFFFVAIFFACQRTSHPINEITKIEFARSGAWSDYGAAICIDSSLQYNYYGGKRNDQYYYTGKITQQLWDTINRKIENINLKKARPDDEQKIADANYYELIIHWKHKKKRFVRIGFVITDSLSRFASWINNSYKNVDLTCVARPIKFETTFQNQPKPRVDQIRFPPPIKQRKRHN